AQTRYGPVQVQITVQDEKVTNVSVVEYPNNNGRDQEINSSALPILASETVKTQTAKIDMVSGATYTSQGYLTSLQSALDQAGL
ncbi:MAG: FMN-binding protein, partial [Actinomycetota bacterium]|nr:FMN-binding protein [Actinomycetota bacterium]